MARHFDMTKNGAYVFTYVDIYRPRDIVGLVCNHVFRYLYFLNVDDNVGDDDGDGGNADYDGDGDDDDYANRDDEEVRMLIMTAMITMLVAMTKIIMTMMMATIATLTMIIATMISNRLQL